MEKALLIFSYLHIFPYFLLSTDPSPHARGYQQFPSLIEFQSTSIYIQSIYFISFFHNSGIEWKATKRNGLKCSRNSQKNVWFVSDWPSPTRRISTKCSYFIRVENSYTQFTYLTSQHL